jgi:WD40 repeat protein
MAAWTVADGSRLVTLGNLDPGKDQWLPTVRGMGWISPSERWLGIFRSFSPMLNFYSLPDLDPVVTLTNRGSIRRFVFSPRGDEVAVASQKFVEFWDTTNWRRTRELTNFMDIVYAADARTLWLVRDFRTAGLYDAKTTQLLLPLPKGALPLALSPDGRKLVICINQRRLQLWDLGKTRQQLREYNLDWEIE